MGRGFCVAVVVALLAMATTAQAAIPEPDADPFYAVPADVGTLANGAVIRSRMVTATTSAVPLPARSWQVLYKTIDNTGQPTATVTTIMVPTLTAPAGAPRPVVSYQFADDGAGTKCAPSYALRGALPAAVGLQSVESGLVAQTLLRGWTVIAPDHEGPRAMFLGAEGQARAVLDGIRAARAFAPAGIASSAPVGLWGYSGGAYASSVAGQLQRRYAPELHLSGVALGGMLADQRETIRVVDGGPFGSQIVVGLVTLDRSYPEYHVASYLNDAGHAALARSQTDCPGDAAAKYPFARLAQFTDRSSAFFGPELAPMFARSDALTFPGVPAVPVYDYHGVQDELVPIGPDRRLNERFCRAGATVQRVESVGEHLSVAISGAPGALDWLADRFSGRPAPNNCSVPPDPVPTAAASCAKGSTRGPQAIFARRALKLRRIGRRVRITLSGRARRRCDVARSTARTRVRRITVALARRMGTRCRYLGPRGGLLPARSCRRSTVLATARGTSRWTFRRTVRLPRGRYRLEVRARDAGGRRSSARVVRFTVR